MATYNPDMTLRNKRALLIGNNNYRLLENRLIHCIKDADDVSAVLKSIGFTTTTHHDLTNEKMVHAIKNFRGSVKDGDLVIFYFSGHGYQVNNENYLMPVDDENIISDADVEDYAIAVDKEIKLFAKKNLTHLTIFILDCCRVFWPKDKPKSKGNSGLLQTLAYIRVIKFSHSGKPSGGLSRIEPPGGTFIQFACGANQTASDGSDEDGNGLFTKCLLNWIATPNLDIVQVSQGLHLDVVKKSNGLQRPVHMNGILGVGDVYLNEVHGSPQGNYLTAVVNKNNA